MLPPLILINYYIQNSDAFNQSIVITKDFLNPDNENNWCFNKSQFNDLEKSLDNKLGNLFWIKIPPNIDTKKEYEILIEKEKLI